MLRRPLKNSTNKSTRTSRDVHRVAGPILATLLLFALWLPGCSPDVTSAHVPPPWLVELPSKKGVLFAVGVCGPTWYPTDAIKRATDAAREELAKSLGGRIRSVILVEESRKGTSVQLVSVTEVTAWASDVVLSCSQVVATWIDINGVYQQGKPGTTYALGSLGSADIGKEKAALHAGSPLPADKVGELRRLAEEVLEWTQ